MTGEYQPSDMVSVLDCSKLNDTGNTVIMMQWGVNGRIDVEQARSDKSKN
jgi:hypothetical protein